ncbi:MAG: ABC transporter substrate-binding protein [Deltaproteobacteria bacterium]|nr:MAG: ABC transporter substrate-binding protein [Deltaproteobacteria bacterium]
MFKRLSVSLIVVLFFTASIASAGTIKIGMITTLSGGGSGLGIAVRDGFKLAIDQEGGKLGGYPVELIVEDDARKPDKATQIADRLIKRDKVSIMTGIIWSNLAIAVVPKVVRAGVFYISPNAGPSLLAGKGCDKNYFNAAWQNDNLHEAMGQYVKDRNFKRVYILAPNYPAGKDALRGFKRFYKGKPIAEVYTKLGQKDYAAEIAAIRSAKPDAVFFFLPGGMGISFIKQYNQAGLMQEIPLFGPAFSFDQTILNAVGKAALGVMNSSQWNKDINNPANKRFVGDFKKTYGRLPSLYASQGYDTARLIGSAIKAVGGDMSKKDAFREALRRADFKSVRGPFRFGPNQHPVQDIYIREVVEEDGLLTNRIVTKAFTNHSDAYVGECKMQ